MRRKAERLVIEGQVVYNADKRERPFPEEGKYIHTF